MCAVDIMAVETMVFGKMPDGRDIQCYTLQNPKGARAAVMNYGATLLRLDMPDRQGRLADVVLGYDTLAGYLEGKYYIGASVGRYANRIAGATFTLNGETCHLAKNDGGRHHLHGGLSGFDRKVWSAEVLAGEPAVRFTYCSQGGEEGYPGTLRMEVSYRLEADNALHIQYRAVSDRDTLLNPTNHTYFNLEGQGSGDILSHTLQIFADSITENTAESIPTGRLLPVEGTPMDFTAPKAIGRDIGADYAQLRYGNGYDHNYVLRGEPRAMKRAAVACAPRSGRRMEVWSDMPGMQLYTANFLDPEDLGKGGIALKPRSGFCLETGFYPDAPHHPGFPSAVLRGGEVFASETVFRFSCP